MFMLMKISLALKARDKNVDKNERERILANSTCHSLRRYTHLKILIGWVASIQNWFLFAIVFSSLLSSCMLKAFRKELLLLN